MVRKDTKEKITRYSTVSIIMRQLYGVSTSGMPGYILLHDVLYKHFEDENKSLDELVQWACKKFIFKIPVEDGYTEIQKVITQNIPDKSEEDDKATNKTLLQKVIKQADELYAKHNVYEAVSNAVQSMDLSDLLEADKQIDLNKIKLDLVKILFEIKRGKSLYEAEEKIAAEECKDCIPEIMEQEKAKRRSDLQKSISSVFLDETELLKFEESISVK